MSSLSLKSLFLLDPKIIFLNHGSFGACPRPVFEVYQTWQRRLEKQPVLLLSREFTQLMAGVRYELGEYLHVAMQDIVIVPNATHAVNIIARSLKLSPGDEILTSDHEYGACDNIWQFICKQTGASYIRQEIPLPITSNQEFIDQLWQGVNPRTRLVFLSHITSATAQLFPIQQVCERARNEGILTFIDGAHAPGQVVVDITRIGADFYTGNAHKWMMSPKGAGFLFARPEVQDMIEPLVVGWGYSADVETTTGSHFIDLLQWSGTHDPSAALSIPAALQFMREHNWEEVRQNCNRLLRKYLDSLSEITGLPSIYHSQSATAWQPLPLQMGIVALPEQINAKKLKLQLYETYKIEIPVIEWNGNPYLRLSIQGYNNEYELEQLIQALRDLLAEQEKV